MAVVTQPSREAVMRAAALVLVGSAGIQTSSAISSGLFASLGPFAVSGLRMAIAAAVLLVLVRPRLSGRSRDEWVGIGAYGVAMAAMNICLYAAIDRIPLGVAVTLEFLGPCAVALAASRRARDAGIAIVGVLGVALISAGPTGLFDAAGYAFALGAAVCFGAYTVFAARVGQAGTGLDGLALSVAVAAVLSAPFGVPAVGSVEPTGWALLAASALIGVVVPYSVDTLAGRITSARVIGTLFAIDPAMGVIVGAIGLSQGIPPLALAGVALVTVSGALLVWSSGRRDRAVPPA